MYAGKILIHIHKIKNKFKKQRLKKINPAKCGARL